MLTGVVIALTLATNIPWYDGKVGPISLGESAVDVQKTLGPGWRGSVSDPRGNKATALIYTDGVDQLQVWLSPDRDLGETVEGIVARENRPEGAPFAHQTALRSWRWAGVTLFETPSQLRGWRVERWSPPRKSDGMIASYEQPDSTDVWFSQNVWGGVDFHTFVD